MNRTPSEQANTGCAECAHSTSNRCEQCGLPFCATHTPSSRFAAHQLFGPFLVKDNEVLCSSCYGERLWLAWRGLVALITLMGIVVGLLQQQWWLPPGAVVIFVVWWWISAGPIRRYQAERRVREQSCSNKEQPAQGEGEP